MKMRGHSRILVSLIPWLLAVSLSSAQTRLKGSGSSNRSKPTVKTGSTLPAPVALRLTVPALNTRGLAAPPAPEIKADSRADLELPALPPAVIGAAETPLTEVAEAPPAVERSQEAGEAASARSRTLFERISSLFSRPDIVPEWPGMVGDKIRLQGETYSLDKRIGDGSTSVVYLSGENKIVKLIYPGLAADPVIGREAESLEALARTDIPHARLKARSADGQVLVKEFVAGITLAEQLKRGPLSFSQKKGLAELGARLMRIGYGADLNPGNLIWNHWRGEWTLVDGGGFALALPSGVFKELASEVLREHGGVNEVELLSAIRGRLEPDSEAWKKLARDAGSQPMLKNALERLSAEDSSRQPAPNIRFEPAPAGSWLNNQTVSPKEIFRRLGFSPMEVKPRRILKRDRVKTNTEVWSIEKNGTNLVLKESNSDIIRSEVAVRAIIKRYFGRYFNTPNSLGVLNGYSSYMVMEFAPGHHSYAATLNLERRVALAILARTFGLSDMNRENVLFAPDDTVTLIDFEQAFGAASPVINRIPDKSILDEMPWVAQDMANSIEDYLPAVASWRELFGRPETQNDISDLLVKSGYSPAEAQALLKVFSGNVSRLPWTISADIEFAGYFQNKP